MFAIGLIAGLRNLESEFNLYTSPEFRTSTPAKTPGVVQAYIRELLLWGFELILSYYKGSLLRRSSKVFFRMRRIR